jgi:hypothetical protein
VRSKFSAGCVLAGLSNDCLVDSLLEVRRWERADLVLMEDWGQNKELIEVDSNGTENR